MPSFIFQVASTAIALAAMHLPTATAAPVNLELLRSHASANTEASYAQARAAPANTIEVRQYHNIHPVMRTMSRDEYYFSTMQNNQHYQTSLQNIHDVTTEESNLVASAEQHARISDAADSAYIGACTAKVVADLEAINAYHRGIMQDADTKYEEGIASPLRHTVNLLELRQARQEALSLPLYSDLDIVQAAEERCHLSSLRASLQDTHSAKRVGASGSLQNDGFHLD